MSWNDKNSQRVEAGEKFIEYMHSSDKAAIVFFTATAQLNTPMSSKESLDGRLKGVYSNGDTNFSAAISKAVSAFNEGDINKSNINNRIILLSDGEDNGSSKALEDEIEKCISKKIKIYTVGFGSARDSLMESIAKTTGGVYFKAFSADDLVKIFARLGYEGDFDMTDTDGDGIPDVVEYAGIRLQNGEILYDCDPDNCDLDCDGLLDGEEVIFDPKKYEKTIYNDDGTIKIIEGYSFRKVSDPTNEDSDSDGIKDYYDAFPLDNSPLKYQNIYSEITMTGSGEHIYKFVAPSSGYYRFELYYDSGRSNDFIIEFVDKDGNRLDCSDEEISGEIDNYNDKRIYCFVDADDRDDVYISVRSTKGMSYNLFITKATAYLCGGKFDDGLDTTVDVRILSGLFKAYGFDVIEYKGKTFTDVYEYTVKNYPFRCTHNEVVVLSCHGIEGGDIGIQYGSVDKPLI